MVIAKGVPLFLQAGWKMENAELTGKKEHIFQKLNFSKGFNFFKSILHMALPIQISTFSKICRGVLFFSTKFKSFIHVNKSMG